MKVRRVRVSTQIFIMVAMILVIADVMLGSFAYFRTRNLLITQHKDSAMNIARTAAASVDGAAFRSLKAGDEGTDAFQKIMDALVVFRDNSGVEYIYTTRKNSDGTVVYVVDSDPEVETSIDVAFGEGGDAFEKALSGTTAANANPVKDEWGEHLSACSPIYDGQEIVGVASVDISMDWINQELRMVGIYVVLICSVVFVASCILLLLVSRMVSRKFDLLYQKLVDITDGSGDLTKHIEMNSGNEFEVISNRINVFMEQIRSLIQSVAGTSESVVLSGERFQKTLEDNARTIGSINDGISMISSSMQECSSTSDTVSGHLADTAERLMEFANQVEQVEHQTREANKTADASASLAQEHRDEAVVSIERIQKEVQKATEEAKVIERVQDIAEEINKIASKTKILSLNAQIEAARAGDQGRGFAVVAMDVEELSRMISVSVEKINEITGQAMDSVDRLSGQSATMSAFITEQVVPDYDAFVRIGKEYGESMQKIEQSMKGLNQASGEISAVVENISRSIQDINDAVGKSASQVGNLSGASADISDRMQSLQEGSAENVLQSMELNQQIEKYQY